MLVRTQRGRPVFEPLEKVAVTVSLVMILGCPSSHQSADRDLGSTLDSAAPQDMGRIDALLGRPCSTICLGDFDADEWPNGILTHVSGSLDCLDEEEAGRFQCGSYITEPYYSEDECLVASPPVVPPGPGRFCTCLCDQDPPPGGYPPGGGPFPECECPSWMECVPMERIPPPDGEQIFSYCVPRELVSR
jgi:hypothetical protein